MKNRLTFIFIILLSSIILSNCTTTSQMYLQSARNTDDSTYGFLISNPIVLKCSKSFGGKKIIEEYIARLFTNINEDDSSRRTTGNLSSLTIIERKTIIFQKSKDKQEENEIIADKSSKSGDSLERYKIKTDNGEKTYTLYFRLVKIQRKFYIPCGFGYGRLAV